MRDNYEQTFAGMPTTKEVVMFGGIGAFANITSATKNVAVCVTPELEKA